MSRLRVTFIGGGNMAEALVKGLLAGGVVPAHAVTVVDVDAGRLARFRDHYGTVTGTDAARAAERADVVVLAVKPQAMEEVLRALAGSAVASALVVSIAAGVTTTRIEAALGANVRVVRAMPNTPALVGAGVSAVCAGRRAAGADLDTAERLLGAVGRVVRVEEPMMDAVTAVSGSGPAYVFHLAEALLAAAEDLGLAPDVARMLVAGTLFGSAKLLRESGLEAGELRRRVTSRGGTTEAALGVLGERKVSEALRAAVAAARDRSAELSGGGPA